MAANAHYYGQVSAEKEFQHFYSFKAGRNLIYGHNAFKLFLNRAMLSHDKMIRI